MTTTNIILLNINIIMLMITSVILFLIRKYYFKLKEKARELKQLHDMLDAFKEHMIERDAMMEQAERHFKEKQQQDKSSNS